MWCCSYLNSTMKLTQQQVKILERRKEQIENYDVAAIVVTIIYAVLLGIFGLNFFTIVLGLVLIFAFPSYWSRKKELTEIEYKLAGNKEK